MFIFGTVSLVYLLIAFEKLENLSKTFHLIETESGLIRFYIANFAYMQVSTLVYGLVLTMINHDSLRLKSCGN